MTESLIDFNPDGTVRATPLLDAWREDYIAGRLTYADHRRLYDRIAEEYPNQNYYSTGYATKFFERYQPLDVVELGGWDGALAEEMMAAFPIEAWTNYEITSPPQVCSRPGYRFVVPDSWAWENTLSAEVFVASHTLEHLTAADLASLVRALDCRAAYVDVPLAEIPSDWTCSTTTHALSYTIDEFERAWEAAGWKVAARHRRTAGPPMVTHDGNGKAFVSPPVLASFVRFLERA